MEALLSSPAKSLTAGTVLAVLLAAIHIFFGGALDAEFLRFVLRWVHVVAAIVFVGLAWFVNFIMLPANYAQDDAGKKVIAGSIALPTIWWVRHSSTLTVAAGLGLAAMSGYFMDTMTIGAWSGFEVAKHVMLGAGMWLAIIMWAFVHMVIWPNMKIMLGLSPGDMEARTAARIKVRNFVRKNLILAIPVVFLMVGAQNLF